MIGPSWRKPVGALAILLLVMLWAVLFATFADSVIPLHPIVQLLYYGVAGLAWIWLLPVKPILRWMQTGRWR